LGVNDADHPRVPTQYWIPDAPPAGRLVIFGCQGRQAHYERIGRVLFGIAPDTTMFAF
jgi:hypothetical protein